MCACALVVFFSLLELGWGGEMRGTDCTLPLQHVKWNVEVCGGADAGGGALSGMSGKEEAG